MKNSEETTDNVVVTNIAFGPPEEVSEDLENAGIITTPEIEEKRAELAKIEEQLKNPGKSLTKLSKAKHQVGKEITALENKAANLARLKNMGVTLDEKDIEWDEYGNIVPEEANYVAICNTFDLAFEQTKNRILIRNKTLPWNRSTYTDSEYWTDHDTIMLRTFLSKAQIKVKEQKVDSAIKAAAYPNGFNPIRDYFNGKPIWDGKQQRQVKKWDGQFRLPGLLKLTLNAEDIILADGRNYADEILKMFLVAVFRLAMGEDVKWDMCPIFVGAQGRGKSTLLKRLAVKPKDWFCEISFDDIAKDKGKSAVEKIIGRLIVEIPEANISKERKFFDAIKGWLSQDSDTVRFCWDKFPSDVSRLCGIAGTTNVSDGSILPDPDGNRRFPIIQLTPGTPQETLYTYLTPEFIDQLWAEVKENYLEINCFIDEKVDPLLYKEVIRQANKNLKTDGKEVIVQRNLAKPLPEEKVWTNWSEWERRDYVFNASKRKLGDNSRQRTDVCLEEVVNECLGKDIKTMTSTEQNQVKQILEKLGLQFIKKRKRFNIYGQVNYYWEIPADLYKHGGPLEFFPDSVPEYTSDEARITALNREKDTNALYAKTLAEKCDYKVKYELLERTMFFVKHAAFNEAKTETEKLHEIQQLITNWEADKAKRDEEAKKESEKNVTEEEGLEDLFL